MIELHGRDRQRARRLFETLPATKGCVTAGLSGEFGRLLVDRADEPTAAWLHLDFHFLAGDHDSPFAEQAVRSIRRPFAILADAPWQPLLRSTHGDALTSTTRTAFNDGSWDREQLTMFLRALPDGHVLFRVTADDVARFTALDRALTVNFRDPAHFVRAGVGFAVEHAGAIVAGCSSFTLAEGQVEFEIDTAPAHRRRGLALATGAALLLHCLDHGLEPCWDAANEGSAQLALRLGFTKPVPYEAWYAKAAED